MLMKNPASFRRRGQQWGLSVGFRRYPTGSGFNCRRRFCKHGFFDQKHFTMQDALLKFQHALPC